MDFSTPHNASPSVSRLEECRSLSDTTTQSCFDPIVLVSVATQTDDIPTTVASDNSSNGSSLVKRQVSLFLLKNGRYPMIITIPYLSPWCTLPYGLDEDSLIQKLKLAPLLKITLTMTFITRKSKPRILTSATPVQC